MPALSPASVVRTSPDRQLSTNLAGEIVILDIEGGLYFGLTDVGVLIWEAMRTPIAINEIVERVVRAYDVSTSTAATDTIELVRALCDRGLVEIDPATGA